MATTSFRRRWTSFKASWEDAYAPEASREELAKASGDALDELSADGDDEEGDEAGEDEENQ